MKDTVTTIIATISCAILLYRAIQSKLFLKIRRRLEKLSDFGERFAYLAEQKKLKVNRFFFLEVSILGLQRSDCRKLLKLVFAAMRINNGFDLEEHIVEWMSQLDARMQDDFSLKRACRSICHDCMEDVSKTRAYHVAVDRYTASYEGFVNKKEQTRVASKVIHLLNGWLQENPEQVGFAPA